MGDRGSYLCTFLSKIMPMYGGGVTRALYVPFCPKPCTVVGEASCHMYVSFCPKYLIHSEPNDISQPRRFNCSMAAILFLAAVCTGENVQYLFRIMSLAFIICVTEYATTRTSL